MVIDMYFPCWNNADLLGFFFRHYDGFVRRYVAFDDGSDDGSLEILRAHPRVEVRRMPKVDPSASRCIVTLSPAETCWRETSADADWVMMADVDEHLHHADLPAYLGWCAREGITIVPSLGYQMVSPHMPQDGLLREQVTSGAPWVNMNKLGVFSPRAITKLNFSAGRHSAEPEGHVVAPEVDELLLLHFKYLDFERVMRRHEGSAARLTQTDVVNGMGHRWGFTREQLQADWADFETRLTDVSRHDLEPWRTHTAPRWWDRYRRKGTADFAPTMIGALTS